MAIIFINCSPINSLNKEPYTTLAKKYKRIEENIDGETIEIPDDRLRVYSHRASPFFFLLISSSSAYV